MSLAHFALLVAICFADGILLLRNAPAMAADVLTNVAPPPPRVENIGRPRDGYAWAAGHWEWNGKAYQWVSGVWILEHGKAHWIADQWEPAGSQWRYVPGHWER